MPLPLTNKGIHSLLEYFVQVLGTAIGLNIVFRIPLLPSLFLMAVDSLICIAVLPLMVIPFP